MKKIKELSKKYLIGFFIGLILFTVVGVSAAAVFPSNQTTYNNGTTGMKATNVQTAIDELYNTCFPPTLGDQILENNDLEKDPYECRYFFTGANPNNYITFNGENAGWRIISVECDGTIKIMKVADINTNDSILMSWGNGSNNYWQGYYGLSLYLNNDYLNYYLNSTAQNQIVAKDWSVGGIEVENNNLMQQINAENEGKWNGKVALITASEYIRSNSDIKYCGTYKLNSTFYRTCKNTTWMYINDDWWTLSIPDYTASYATYLNKDGIFGNTETGRHTLAVRPSVYLSSDIKITGGDGSQSNPYQLSV